MNYCSILTIIMSARLHIVKRLLICLFFGSILQHGNCTEILPRRYDINDLGVSPLYHGWADVQGQGAANDFCRIVGSSKEKYQLSCALAGTNGLSEYNYNSIDENFDIGYPDTWYMKDEDNDGRDDYCRCIKHGTNEEYQVVCTKAGRDGFHGSPRQGGSSRTFTTTGPINCKDRKVFPEFGRPWGFPFPE